MDKAPILEALRAHLSRQLDELAAAAAAAREGATHEEAKPENEYDTRALEQSYLAGAQAARVENLAAAVASLEALVLPEVVDGAPCVVGAAVVVDDGEEERRYFLSQVGGGAKLDVDGQRWLVLTASSPLGQRLLGRQVGDLVVHTVRGQESELEVIAVF